MSLKVLLVNPWIHDFSAYDCWNKPIGLLSLASFLRKNGLEVYFVDCLDPDGWDFLDKEPVALPKRKPAGEGAYPRQIIPKPPALRGIPRHYCRYGVSPGWFLSRLRSLPMPDIVMMTSMMTYWYPAVFETIRLVQETLPGIPVVLGGNYVTLCPEHAATSGADFTLAGPAEQTIPSLLKRILCRDIHWLPDRNCLDSYPYPAFDLIPHPKQVPIMASRGCPHRCTYCASHLTGGAYQRRDPIRVADEIEHWHRRLGVAHFAFYDDALLSDPYSLALPLLRELIRRDMAIQFHCPNGLHLREMTAELANLMYQAGFRTVRFGFETSDGTRQVSTGGKADNRVLTEAVRHLKEAGYDRESIGVYLLCGLPGQSAEEVMESIRFVRRCGGRPILAEYSPIPGTGLWKEAMDCSPYPIADEPLFQNNTLLPCRNESLTCETYHSLKLMCRNARHDPQLCRSRKGS